MSLRVRFDLFLPGTLTSALIKAQVWTPNPGICLRDLGIVLSDMIQHIMAAEASLRLIKSHALSNFEQRHSGHVPLRLVLSAASVYSP